MTLDLTTVVVALVAAGTVWRVASLWAPRPGPTVAPPDPRVDKLVADVSAMSFALGLMGQQRRQGEEDYR